MKELSIEQMEQVKGGTCSSDELFAYSAATSYYGIKSAKNPGDSFSFHMWLFYSNKIFGCI
jgi:bacteriocin-like protein